jgi:hypothetical protein
MSTTRLRQLLAGLLIGSAVLFAIGIAIEKSEGSHHDTEKILGVSPESTGVVAAAVVISVLLAIGVLRWPSRALFVIVGVVCLVFAIADIVEGAEKFEGSEAGIGVIALVVAIGHLTAALISGHLAARPQEHPQT